MSLKVKITAAPEKGKANKAVIAVLAKALGIARTRLDLVSGETARTKTVRIDGDQRGIAAALDAALHGN